MGFELNAPSSLVKVKKPIVLVLSCKVRFRLFSSKKKIALPKPKSWGMKSVQLVVVVLLAGVLKL